MKSRDSIFLTLLWSGLFLSFFTLHARDYSATPLPFASSLPSREITSLHQDREGMIWIGTTHGVARYDGYETIVFKSDPLHPDLLTDNSITLITDTEHRVFIGTQNGLNLFDKQTWKWMPVLNGAFCHTEIKYVYTDKKQQLWIATAQALYRCDEQLHILRRYDLKAAVTSIYEDHAQHLWILTWGKGLFRWDAEKDHFTGYPAIGNANIPFVLFQDRDEHYWLGTWGDGLFRFYPERNGADMYEHQDVADDIFFDIEQDGHNGQLWMLSYNALHIFNRPTDGILHFSSASVPFDRNRMFSTLLRDREGDLWLGAFDAGYHISFCPEELSGHSLPFIKETLGFDTNINCMYEDEGGVLWFNQERNGIGLYAPDSGTYNLHPYSQKRNVEVNLIARSRFPNTVWIASAFVPTVFRAQRQGMDIRFTDTLLLAHDGAETGHVTGMLEDPAGRLWVMTERKLFVFKPDGHPLAAVTNLPGNVNALCEDQQGRLWISDATGRLSCMHTYPTGIRPTTRYKLPLSPHDRIRHLCCDSTGHIWMATELGCLYSFYPKASKWSNHTLSGLPDMSPVLHLEAIGKDLWLVTPSAVIRYNPEKRTRHTYNTQDKHVPVFAFRNNASCTGHKKLLYAGGHGGFITIRTDKPQPEVKPDKIFLTDLRIEDRNMQTDPCEGFSWNGGLIVLPPEASRIEFRFSSLTYSSSGNIRIAYRLADLDRNPIQLRAGVHTAFYDRLPKGTYTLEVWGMDENGHTTGPSTIYTVVKRPRWFETWTAYTAYAVMFLVLCICGFRLYAKHLRKKNAQLLREEIARTKLEYFTNVSHELLTPLTVLSCLTDEIEQNSPSGSPITRGLRDNILRLKKLIRQVLDFRKAEQKSLSLQASYGDVAAFIRHIAQTDFTLLARKKEIDFNLDIFPEDIYGFYDADKLEEMVFNLLSNAVKYTPSRHNVGIRLRAAKKDDGKHLRLEVWDEGIGISAQEQTKVFTRFYRSPQANGTESNGIGLSLTRDLVYLHHGTLDLQSTPGKGSRFTIDLPLEETAYQPEEICQPPMVNHPDTDTTRPSTDGLAHSPSARLCPTILIVDDNAEITDSIGRLIGQRYHIITAHDARLAFSRLQDQNIDLMVCDLKMPGTDGLTLCREVKNDLSTSHIPVIILTAQATDDTHAACYEAGADGYLTKPFDIRVLTTRIDNLLLQYRQRSRQFLHAPDTDCDVLPYQNRDKTFLENMVKTVESHFTDSDFNLDCLTAEAKLSKSTMNRKLKAMTGLTPMDFVKNIRLRSACRLLRQADMTVSEVAYAVGFNDPKYFAKCFKEEYGQTPSQFQDRPDMGNRA